MWTVEVGYLQAPGQGALEVIVKIKERSQNDIRQTIDRMNSNNGFKRSNYNTCVRWREMVNFHNE